MRRGWAILVGVGCAMIATARAESITVSAADCRKLTEHVPAKDVAYQPGVDVHGKAVAPADLNGGYDVATLMPEDVTIPISIDLASRLGRTRARQNGNPNPTTADRPLRPYESGVPVGAVTLNGNTVMYNGQPLMPQDQATLAAACRQRLAVGTPPPPKPAAPEK